MTPLVLLTGANGFLGAHTALALLQAGYGVRAAVRDVNKAASRFAGFVPEAQRPRLSFVPLDLTRDYGWHEAAQGCAYVVHSASPVPFGPVANAAEVIEPACAGTLRALRAARTAGVQRIVVTSSTAAVLWGHPRDGSKIFDEQDWSVLTPAVAAYERSKTLAEQAAWRYMAELPKNERFELVTILPGAILGPLLDGAFSVSGQIVRALLARELPGIPDLGFALADVRDVAAMHVAAMTAPAAANQRFIVAGEHTPLADIARILARELTPRGFRIPRRPLPSLLIKAMAFWDATAALVAAELGKRQDVSSERARQLLGWTPRSTEEMTLAMAESMLEHGVVPAPRARR